MESARSYMMTYRVCVWMILAHTRKCYFSMVLFATTTMMICYNVIPRRSTFYMSHILANRLHRAYVQTK